jgi:hypothetical protein
MALIVTASALLHTGRHDEEAKSQPWSGTNWYAMTIVRTDVQREVHGEQLQTKTIGVAAKTIS